MKEIPYIFKNLSLLLLLTILLISCNSDSNNTTVKEQGIIEFETKAVDQTHPLSAMAPGSATLKYKKDKFIMEMSTMGLFNTKIIGDRSAKTIAQTVKFMDINQACIENEADIIKENSNYKLVIEETKETKKIIGLKCYKLKVSMVNNPSVTFDAWYTKDLGMENSNVLTPYSTVKGVLLDYRAKRMGMEMRFLAKSAKNIEIPNNTFEIDTNIKIISKAEMTKFFNEL